MHHCKKYYGAKYFLFCTIIFLEVLLLGPDTITTFPSRWRKRALLLPQSAAASAAHKCTSVP